MSEPKWFAASVLVALRLRSGLQSEIPVFENVYLIEADEADVHSRAEAVARANLVDDDTLALDGQPAVLEFVGIRKIDAVEYPIDADDTRPPGHGCELTWSEYVVASADDLQRLVAGASVPVIYV